MQLSIAFDDMPPLARRRDPETSKQAAAEAKELQAQHHRVILWALGKYGPAGKDRLGTLTSLTGVQICRRLTELERTKQIQQTGRTVTSTAGRPEREWRIA